VIILFGVLGSGKSEQAARMVSKLKCPHISTSQLIREQGNKEWINQTLQGKLLPDDIIFELLEPALKKIHADKQEFILDGAPRSIGQAKWLIQRIRSGEIKLTAIIHLKVSRKTTIERMLKRGREDDTKEVINERFKQYETNTKPVLDYLREQGFEVIDIDGEWSSDMVELEIWKVLEGKLDPQIT
jgi:adenylate kinase